MIRRLVAVALACACAALGAQTLPLRYLQHAEGLSNLAVTALALDEQQGLWAGTENGVFRYDGERMAAVDIANVDESGRVVGALLAEGQGRVWLGMRGALLLWQPGGLAPVRVGAQALPVDDGRTLAPAPQGAWVVSRGDLLRVRGAASEPALMSVQTVLRQSDVGRVNSVLQGADGDTWLGCGRGLCRLKGTSLQRYGPAEGVPDGRWAGLLQAHDGVVWARSDARVVRLASSAARFRDVTPAGLSQGTVHMHLPMAEDGLGRVIVHTDTGLLRWEGEHWQAFGATQGLTVGGGVHAMVFDPAGDLWLGTAGHGLAHWRGYRHWRNWTRAQGLPSDEAWSFADAEDGRIWIGSGSGAVLFDPAQARVVPTPPGSGQQVGHLVRDAQERLWASTFGGQIWRRRDDGPWQRVASGLPLTFSLQPLPDGGLLAGTNDGLYRVSDTSEAHPTAQRVAAVSALAKERVAVKSMCAVDNLVWLATSSGLLSHDAQGRVLRAAIPGLPTTDLGVIACGQGGRLWLAHDDGRLWQVTRGADGVQTAQRVVPEPLGQRLIVSMLEDRRGWLWLGTDNGLLVRADSGWRRFDDSNGLVWDDANGYALHEDAAGSLWVGTSRGVSQIVDPARMLEPVPLPFEIDSVRHGPLRWRPGEPVVLPWSHEPLRVDWHRRGFTNRSSDLIHYRLGHEQDDGWNPGEPTGLRFDALPPGEHRLEVYASNPALGARSATLTLNIVVTPPWWRTPWMYVACGAIALALGWLAYRWRLRGLMQHQRQLEAQVRLRTQDLAASHEAMRKLALTDSLTGVSNRRAIMDAAGREFARVQRSEGSLTLALVDIDHFKRVNDSLGHPAGDEVLRQVVARLAATLRANDLLGRYGGEEFLVLLPSGPTPDGADVGPGLQRLRSVIADQPFDLGDLGSLSLTCSIGAASALAPALPGHSLETLIQAADRALYRVKAAGRNGVAWATP